MKIDIESLAMRFRDGERDFEIFSNVSISLPAGSSLAIMGESGVGKTTLLYCLGGLETPSSGSISFNGLAFNNPESTALERFRRQISFIFQFNQLLPEFDATENVAMPLIIRGESENHARKAATDLLIRVGLEDRTSHRPGLLSGGEQQRVAVARSLVTRPGLILADEPTGSLDAKTGKIIISLIQELQREAGSTLILVTHSKEVAFSLDSVAELTPTGLSRV
jgi:lipoprotein-releasing system ATP-binding protein